MLLEGILKKIFGDPNEKEIKNIRVIVDKINLRSGGVHLYIRFNGEVKCIDQMWLMRSKYT